MTKESQKALAQASRLLIAAREKSLELRIAAVEADQDAQRLEAELCKLHGQIAEQGEKPGFSFVTGNQLVEIDEEWWDAKPGSRVRTDQITRIEG